MLAAFFLPFRFAGVMLNALRVPESNDSHLRLGVGGARGIFLAFPIRRRHAERAAERLGVKHPGFGWEPGARGILAFPVRRRHAERAAGA